jgi:RimK-like ATP-grasp domain
MIVVLSNSLDITADYVCSRLEKDRFDYIRLNTDELTEKAELLYQYNNLSLKVVHRKLRPEDISSVWCRRPKPLSFPDGKHFEKGEQTHTLSEWSAAIEGFFSHIPSKLWINHPRNNASASSKLEQLSRAKRFGLDIPRTLVSQSFDEVIQFWKACEGRLVTKPISHGYIERDDPEEDAVIFTNEVTLEQLNENQNNLSLCPTLFQEKVEKLCDVRINVIDQAVIATAIYSSAQENLQDIDIRRNNMSGVRYETIKLPSSLEGSLLKLCRSYKLRFAAIDMAITTDAKWVFFEINPNGQWAWLDLEGITDIASYLLMAMQASSS